MFRQAAAAGATRWTARNSVRCYPVLPSDSRKTPRQPRHSPVELRISLNNTREFGMVLSAGLGGLDAELDESNFRKDRASVYAAAELTDAEDFLGLFRRTLAYQKLASLAKRADCRSRTRSSRPVFERLLALASGYSPGNPAAAFRAAGSGAGSGAGRRQLLVHRAPRCEFGAPVAGRLPARSTRSTS